MAGGETPGRAHRWRIFLGCEIEGRRNPASELLEPVARWLVEAGVDSCTVTPSSGFVDGSAEETLVIEVLAPVAQERHLLAVVEALRAEYRQDSVLWTRDDVVHGAAVR